MWWSIDFILINYFFVQPQLPADQAIVSPVATLPLQFFAIVDKNIAPLLAQRLTDSGYCKMTAPLYSTPKAAAPKHYVRPEGQCYPTHKSNLS